MLLWAFFFYHDDNNDHAENDDNDHADNDRQSSWQGPMQRSLAGWKQALALQSGEYILQSYNHFFIQRLAILLLQFKIYFFSLTGGWGEVKMWETTPW